MAANKGAYGADTNTERHIMSKQRWIKSIVETAANEKVDLPVPRGNRKRAGARAKAA